MIKVNSNFHIFLQTFKRALSTFVYTTIRKVTSFAEEKLDKVELQL